MGKIVSALYVRRTLHEIRIIQILFDFFFKKDEQNDKGQRPSDGEVGKGGKA